MTNFEKIFLEALNIKEDLTDHDHPYMWEIVDKDSEEMTAYSEYEYDSKKDATDAAMKAFDTKNIDKANSILIVSKKTSDEIPLKEEIDTEFSVNSEPFATVDIYEVDENLNIINNKLCTISVSIQDIIDTYGIHTVKQALKGFTKETFNRLISDKHNILISDLVNGVATKEFMSMRRNDPTLKNKDWTTSNIQYVNTDAFDTSEKALQKYLGKILLPQNESYNKKSLKESYGEDVYFRAYITNLGKYNEGDLVGEWVEFPIDENEFNAILERIGVDGVNYEEWFVTDYECSLDAFDWQEFGEYPSYEELQEFGLLLEDIDDVTAINNAYEFTGNLQEAIEGLENGDIIFIDGIRNDSDLGQYVVDEMYGGPENLDPSTIEECFDYEALGRDLDMDMYGEDGELTAGEYFCGNEDASHSEIGMEYVDGVGIEGVAHPEYYFDYEEFGRQIDMETDGMFTSDGYVERI